MVVKINSGNNIQGALSYNEQKVKEREAVLLSAENYPKAAHHLSFSDKLQMLTLRTELAEDIRHQCVHISLNFLKEDQLSDKLLKKIAKVYMEKIGFGEQPFLVYRHDDTHHPHVHIVATSIQADGTPIYLHGIGKTLSAKAREEIEKEYNLIAARGRKQAKEEINQEVAPLKAGALKHRITNDVRRVIGEYNFTSLAEFNFALAEFNIAADQGSTGSRTFSHDGLVYYQVDHTGNRVSAAIKASSIYTNPTLKCLRQKFIANKKKRQQKNTTIRDTVGAVLRTWPDKTTFEAALLQKEIKCRFYTNKDGLCYGISFLDCNNKVVVKASDLGKAFSTTEILKVLHAPKAVRHTQQNSRLVGELLARTDYTKGFRDVLIGWLCEGVDFHIYEQNGKRIYAIGKQRTDPSTFTQLPEKLQRYCWVNEWRSREIQKYQRQLHHETNQHHPAITGGHALQYDLVCRLVDAAFAVENTGHVSSELLKEARKKKRRRPLL